MMRAWVDGTSPARRWVVLVVAAIAVSVSVVTVVWWRTPSPDAPTAPAVAQDRDDAQVGASEPPQSPEFPIALNAHTDPVDFAVAVSTAIFAWDTTASAPRDASLQRIVAVADPSGVSTPGLVDDLTAYLPSETTWVHLAQYRTRQWLTVDEAAVPEGWRSVLESTDDDVLAPGTTAVTVDGIRHRAGLWEGQEVADRFRVAFTVWVVCEPTYPTCHLLRVGRLDVPMR